MRTKLFSVLSGSFFRSLCIVEQSFHGQADTFLVEVDVSDLNLNFLTDGQNILRFIDSFVGDLRNVDQTVNTWDNLSECTESGQIGRASCRERVSEQVLIGGGAE